jgi:glycine/D-amino acid oxidase-like deaminating enzyme
MPDKTSVIGPILKVHGIFHAFGFAANGRELSHVAAITVSELILD